jgi:hypothetical protein
MGVLDAFTSTWSNARTTFGQGTPQTGEPFDASGPLRQLQSDLGAAAPGSRWRGAASSAYDAVNTEHRRVIGELGGLDQRLRSQIDRSAQVVTAGRADLDAVRKWVLDAANAVPRNAAGERMLLPIVQKGIGEVAQIVARSNGELNAIGAGIRGLDAEYRALDDQKFAAGDRSGKDGKTEEPQNPYEKALREAGLLNGPPPEGYYKEWLENAERQGVPPVVIVDIARRHDITPESFNVLNGMEKITDKDGKSFFLIRKGTSGEDARKAALMTYILNAGTDYGEHGTGNDFTPEPYSADEVQRIIDRQGANSWTYDKDVGFVDSNGGRLTTTPNGMLMGLGGNQLQDMYSEAGGSTWGDIFMLNIDDPTDAAKQLKQVAESGQMWYPAEDGNGRQGRLDLDRILHHEERHSQQWADKGYGTMLREYGWEIFREKVLGKTNRLEEDAGLSDGGYQ